MFSSRNPFLSRSHSLGVLLKWPCLRDPCVVVPQSGDPSVWEQAFSLGVVLWSPLSLVAPLWGSVPRVLSWSLTGLKGSWGCLSPKLVCARTWVSTRLHCTRPHTHTHTGRSSQQRGRGLANAQLCSGLARSGQTPPLCRPARPSPRGQLGTLRSPGPHSPPQPRLPATGSRMGLR